MTEINEKTRANLRYAYDIITETGAYVPEGFFHSDGFGARRDDERFCTHTTNPGALAALISAGFTIEPQHDKPFGVMQELSDIPEEYHDDEDDLVFDHPRIEEKRVNAKDSDTVVYSGHHVEGVELDVDELYRILKDARTDRDGDVDLSNHGLVRAANHVPRDEFVEWLEDEYPRLEKPDVVRELKESEDTGPYIEDIEQFGDSYCITIENGYLYDGEMSRIVEEHDWYVYEVSFEQQAVSIEKREE